VSLSKVPLLIAGCRPSINLPTTSLDEAFVCTFRNAHRTIAACWALMPQGEIEAPEVELALHKW
jgi:hypothetical protein